MQNEMQVAVIIPARLASERLPEKPLADIAGKPMVVRVLERAKAARGVAHVVVATDSDRIAQAVRAAGGNAVMTSPDCASGSDRCADAARQLERLGCIAERMLPIRQLRLALGAVEPAALPGRIVRVLNRQRLHCR